MAMSCSAFNSVASSPRALQHTRLRKISTHAVRIDEQRRRRRRRGGRRAGRVAAHLRPGRGARRRPRAAGGAQQDPARVLGRPPPPGVIHRTVPVLFLLGFSLGLPCA
uniref:Uncharacterized protein n=1 Tax=Triticum urartu TaxID=4572 RepID=A0A8R7K3Q2_TRIUA